MEKKKGNTIRLIIWGFLAFISLGCGIVGYINYSNNYKEIEDYLKKISNTFDEAQIIKDYENVNVRINSEISRNVLIITYTGAEVKKYNFEYEGDAITTIINTNDSINNSIAMVVIDSINVLNGGERENTYKLFRENKLDTYTFDKGISIETISNYQKKLIINTKVLIENEEENIIINYFLKEDFTTSEINNNELIKSKFNNILVRSDYNTISIGNNNGFNEELSKSIENILDALYGEEVKNEFIQNVNINQNNDYTGELFDLLFNPEPNEKEKDNLQNKSFVRIVIK